MRFDLSGLVRSGQGFPGSAPRPAAFNPEGGRRKAEVRLEGIGEMSVAGKPQVKGQPRDVATTRQVVQRAIEPQPPAVAAERHALAAPEGVGEVSAGHLHRARDILEREGFADVCVQVLLRPVHDAQRRACGNASPRPQRFGEQGDHQLVGGQRIATRAFDTKQAVSAQVHACGRRFGDAPESRMPRWHGVAAQFLEQAQVRRDDDAAMPAAGDVTVDVVFPGIDEKHASAVQERDPGAHVKFECAGIRKDELVFRGMPAGRRVVARRAEIFDAPQAARMQGAATNARRDRSAVESCAARRPESA